MPHINLQREYLNLDNMKILLVLKMLNCMTEKSKISHPELLGYHLKWLSFLKKILTVTETLQHSCINQYLAAWITCFCKNYTTTSCAHDIWGSEQSLRVVCESITEKDSRVILTGFWLDSRVIWNLGLIHVRDSALVMKQFSERISKVELVTFRYVPPNNLDGYPCQNSTTAYESINTAMGR